MLPSSSVKVASSLGSFMVRVSYKIRLVFGLCSIEGVVNPSYSVRGLAAEHP